MQIAVLISTYNGGQYLSEQLASIAKQTLSEYITVYIRDDGSKDNTFEIIEKWKNEIPIVLIKGANVGPAKSFWELLINKDIQADYFLFCDQDDVWNDDKVEKSISPLTDNTYLTLCNCSMIDSQGEVLDEMRVKSQPIINIQRLFITGVGQGCAMAFRKELRNYVMNIPLKNIPMHDVILMLYALTLGDVVWIEEPLFKYRLHSNNVVAKGQKGIVKKIRTTYWNWKNGSDNSMSNVAWELLKYGRKLLDDDMVFLQSMSNYRGSLSNKIKLIFNKNCKYIESSAVRSYRIRLVLNIL